MKYRKHLSFDQMKLIAHKLSKTYKLNEMADLPEVDALSISKGIKRNRFLKKGIVPYTVRYKNAKRLNSMSTRRATGLIVTENPFEHDKD